MNKYPHTIHVMHDGTINWQGVDTGPTTLVAIKESERLLVLKIAGHNYWSNRMDGQRYAPAKYQVHRYDQISRDEEKLVARVDLFGIVEFGARGEARPLPELLAEAFDTE